MEVSQQIAPEVSGTQVPSVVAPPPQRDVDLEKGPSNVDILLALDSDAAYARFPWLPRAAFLLRRGTKVLALGCLLATFVIALTPLPPRVDELSREAQGSVLSGLFAIGLLLVILEDHIGMNKSAIMLLVAAAMWTFLAVGLGHEEFEEEIGKGVKEVAQIVLFLLPAMGVVESMDHFDGFAVVMHVIDRMTGGRRTFLMPALCIFGFFLSSIIDNMTATIVCLKILRKVAGGDRHFRHIVGGGVVIAANAGGVWSPVGDVTTTMLWIQHKISVSQTVLWLFLPSLVAGVLPMAGLWWQANRALQEKRGRGEGVGSSTGEADSWKPVVTFPKVVVLLLGISCILLVPALKIAVGLPPYMGMLLALGVMWFVTDTHWFHHFTHTRPEVEAERTPCDEHGDDGTPHTPTSTQLMEPSSGVVEALHKMDLTGLLFFAGVLLAVAALDSCGVLRRYADSLVGMCGNNRVAIALMLGLSSAVVDNVPLVQAAIHMFSESTPKDDPLWQLVALAGGVGGSVLSVGSIAGVMLMTMEGVGYVWYLRKVSFWGLLGLLSGIGAFELQRALLG